MEGGDAVELEGADIGIGAVGRRPGFAALVGAGSIGRDGAAQGRIVGASRRAMVRVGPPLSARPPANSDARSATFSRSPATLPATSLPKMLWPLLLVTAADVTTALTAYAVAGDDAVGQRQVADDMMIPPPLRHTPVVLLSLTVLLVSVTATEAGDFAAAGA